MGNPILGMPSDVYHSFPNTFSSSQLKTMLEDLEVFHKKYITKEIERESNSAFDIGSYFHCAILEPEKMKDDCAVFSGVRRGKIWEDFKLANAGKAIITESEMIQANYLINSVKSSKIAMDIISSGIPEVSAFVELYVTNGMIFCEGHTLTVNGWVKTPDNEVAFIMANGLKLTLKVRADLLCEQSGVILDLKSTRGNVKDVHGIKSKISAYSYDLSAALYLDIFTISTGIIFRTFILTFASKDVIGNCQNYILSEENIRVGRKKWEKAVLLLADCIKNDWQFEEKIIEIGPNFYEKEILTNNDEGEDL